MYGYDQIDVRRKNATNCSTNISERKSKCPLCNLNHKLHACSLFKQKNAIDRLDFVKSRNLCLVCFDKGHDNIVCTKNISCRICKDKHSTYIHVSDNHNSSNSTSNNRLSSASQGAISNFISNINDTCSDIDNSTYMPIVNVVINNVYPTIALLDNASSNTFITIQAANNAGLRGRPVSYNLSTLGASNRIDTKLWTLPYHLKMEKRPLI